MLSVHGMGKYYGGSPVFTQVSLSVAPGEKIGVIGRNGAGKSTLLRCLAGVVEPDEGQVTLARGTRVAYLSQRDDGGFPGLSLPLSHGPATVEAVALEVFRPLMDLEGQLRAMEAEMAQGADDPGFLARYGRVLETFESSGGYTFRARTHAVLAGLGFDSSWHGREVADLSGGERVRLALACMLLAEPDLLLLDEPTNHLDLEAVEWLEAFLQRFPKAVIVVSHDRTFLDRVTRRTWEVEGGRVTEYRGSYSQAMAQQAADRLRRQREYEAYVARKTHLEQFVQRFRAGTRARQAQDRLKKLERLQPPPVFPDARDDKPALRLSSSTSSGSSSFRARVVCAGDQVTVRFGGRTVLDGVSFTVRAGDRIALVGPNGAGKTTLLRCLVGELLPTAGYVEWAPGVGLGYFAQQRHDLPEELTVLDALLERYALPRQEARRLLASFLFTGDQVEQRVATLSGGEKARLALLFLMLSDAQVLLLDEPTNHLDLPSRTALEEALEQFPGTLIVVSHDRYFLERTTEKTWILEDGALTVWDGTYASYREQQARGAFPGHHEQGLTNANGPAAADRSSPAGGSSLQVRGTPSKEIHRTARGPSAALQRRLSQVEAEIFRLEELKEELGRRLADPELYRQGDEGASRAVERYREVEEKLQELYDLWADLAEK